MFGRETIMLGIGPYSSSWMYLTSGNSKTLKITSSAVKQQLFYGRPAVQMQTLYFYPLSSFCFFFFSSPNLSSRRLDVYHTSTHGVALVQI